jgi:hypothetical protein
MSYLQVWLTCIYGEFSLIFLYALQARKLDVGDSLKYLDSIKLRFLHAPHVYERFLDIMKSFKDNTYVNALILCTLPPYLFVVSTVSTQQVLSKAPANSLTDTQTLLWASSPSSPLDTT